MDFHSAIGMLPRGAELAAMLVVVCFSAGLNVYATVAMLGVVVASMLAIGAGLTVARILEPLRNVRLVVPSTGTVGGRMVCRLFSTSR